MLRDDARIQATLAGQGLRALVATSPENVRYLTDYDAPGLLVYRYPGVYAVARPDRDPVLIISLAGLEYMTERPVATKDIRTTGRYHVERRPGAQLAPAEEQLQSWRATCPHYRTAEDALLAVLGEAGSRGPVAVDERGLTPAAWRSLARRLPGVPLVEAAVTFVDLRRRKTAAEVALLRQAAAINERAATDALALARPGVSELELEEAFRGEVARAGADPGHWETTIGPRSSGSFHAGAYRARPGDLVRSDSSCRYRGYWSDTGRTRVIGAPSPEHRRTYEVIRAAQQAALESVRPGIRAGELFALAVETARRAGLPHFQRHHVGHGIGLEMYEPPLLVEGADDRLDPGMVVNIEVPYYEAGHGGFQVEDTVLVTETGCELLTVAARDLVVLGG